MYVVSAYRHIGAKRLYLGVPFDFEQDIRNRSESVCYTPPLILCKPYCHGIPACACC